MDNSQRKCVFHQQSLVSAKSACIFFALVLISQATVIAESKTSTSQVNVCSLFLGKLIIIT